MPTRPMISQRDLELRIGADNVARMTNDDGGTEPDPEIMQKVLIQASSRARTLLFRGFPSNDQIEELVACDEGVKMLVEDIGIGLMGDRRPGFIAADGRTPYSAFRTRAEKALRDVADGADRSAGEEAAGGVGTVAGEAKPARAQRDPVFAATANDPKGPGGF